MGSSGVGAHSKLVIDRDRNYFVMMKYQHLFAVLVFSVTISFSMGHIGGGQLQLQNADPQVYCGRTLAKALALLCFDESTVGKRSDPATMYDSILLPYYKSQDTQFDWPLMSPHKARTMAFSSRGKRYPGVVNECCDKACSINELMTYC